MHLSEINGNIAKIEYDENNLSVFDCIYIGDIDFSLTGQVCKTDFNTSENNGTADVRICFMTDENGDISEYDGSIPSENAVIQKIATEGVTGLLKSDDSPGVFIGNSLNDGTPIVVDKSLFEENLYVLSDKPALSLCENFITSFKDLNSKTLFLDFSESCGQIEGFDEKLTLGRDFSLPLNEDAFTYILENETDECDEECKNQLTEIITELIDYIPSIPEKFIPFDIFKNIIDEKLSTETNEGLLFFAGKLNDYEEKKIFANSAEDFDFVNNIECGLIDVPVEDKKFGKLVLKSVCEQIKDRTVVLCDVNDENTDDEIINDFYSNGFITFVPFVNYGNKFVSEFDSQSKSKIMFKPSDEEFIPEGEEGFFNVLDEEDYVLTGENLLSFVFGAGKTVIKEDSEEKQDNEEITDEDLDNIDMFVTGSSKEYVIAEDTTEEQNPDENPESENNEYFEENSSEKKPEDFERKITERTIETDIYRPIKRDTSEENQNQSRTYKAALADLPIYEAKQPNTETVEFKPGMKVSHAKYGTGTVEKVIAYGRKTLCSIQFDNVGRRLLDPVVTPLSRV